MATLVSFDIDGTMEMGDPAGPVPVSLVRTAIALGYIVGSASDRTVLAQRKLWAACDIEVDFVGGKHHLSEVSQRWPCDRMVHIGDTDVDAHYARLAGFEFVHIDALPVAGAEGWIF
jgi:hypothetical protein